MKKTGLKEMKRRNREMLIRTILEKGELSRIELAHETQLSPSTVSALVGELLEGGDSGRKRQRAITAGRSRTALDINTEYGCIAVVNIGRKGASLDLFDMCLEPLQRQGGCRKAIFPAMSCSLPSLPRCLSFLIPPASMLVRWPASVSCSRRT